MIIFPHEIAHAGNLVHLPTADLQHHFAHYTYNLKESLKTDVCMNAAQKD